MNDCDRDRCLSEDSIVPVDCGENVDLGDAILMDLGDTIFCARKMFGENIVKIESSVGIFDIVAPEEDPLANFDNRLNGIIVSAKMFAEQARVDYHWIAGLLLVLDGWSWNMNVFRAPIWMYDHREIPIDNARKIKGFEWLTGTSLEIRSKLKEGLVKFEE